MRSVFITYVGGDWEILRSFWGSQQLRYIVLLIILAFLGREIDLRLSPQIRNKIHPKWGEPFVPREQSRMGLSVMLGVLLITGFFILLFESVCPFHLE